MSRAMLLGGAFRIDLLPCFCEIRRFQDTVLPKKHGRNYACIDKTPEGIPLLRYLERIGKLDGQKLDYGNLVTTTDSRRETKSPSPPQKKNVRKAKIIEKYYSLRNSLNLLVF
jgi:hypothetical protein